MATQNVDENIEKKWFESLIKAINKVIDLKKEDNPTWCTKNDLAEQFFEIVFYIGQKRIEFSEEKRKVIGPLIKEIIPFLKVYIIYIGHIYDEDNESYNLLQRSGIQFLLDDFKEFPVSNEELLGDSLNEIQDSEGLETLEEAMAYYKDNPPIGYDSAPLDPDYSVRPEGVPETHFWWS